MANRWNDDVVERWVMENCDGKWDVWPSENNHARSCKHKHRRIGKVSYLETWKRWLQDLCARNRSQKSHALASDGSRRCKTLKKASLISDLAILTTNGTRKQVQWNAQWRIVSPGLCQSVRPIWWLRQMAFTQQCFTNANHLRNSCTQKMVDKFRKTSMRNSLHSQIYMKLIHRTRSHTRISKTSWQKLHSANKLCNLT